ncbi:hypothetical protein [Dyadobacter sp. NIV53]|uniref:hypothetical protein n=1 Tax=Dyadobacter sp. NIV53 TaxID=2861765 RepID=UPI001C8771F3|nr:hypothetical protein [Dyadobacter sp. NIV53]
MFNLDISKAYPLEAKVKKWNRTVVLERDKGIDVEEVYELEIVKGKTYLSFLTPCNVDIEKGGIIKLTTKDSAAKTGIILNYNPGQLEVTLEEKVLTDKRMQAYWGKKVTRILLSVKNTKLTDTISYHFTSSE